MKSNFEEQREAKKARFLQLAAKNEGISLSRYNAAKEIGSFIPMGQPILVGHHSEGRHRRDLNRIDTNMRKSIEADDKAKYYSDRYESLAGNTAISSDDPEALAKLRKKLQALQLTQDLYKAVNKAWRSKKNDMEKIADLVAAGFREPQAAKIVADGSGIPSYKLTNNNAVIKATADRIAKLEKIESLETSEIEINGVKIVQNVEDNRLQMFFDGKPSDEIREKLKRNGFRWSPTVGAWQRMISNGATYAAKLICQSIGEIKKQGTTGEK